MKKTIRLNNQGLKNIIRESLRRYLTEVDWSTYPTSTDYRDKDAWWKTQVDSDFPGHKVDQSSDWKVTYSDLALDKKKRDKEQAKIDRQNAREAKKQARLAAQAEKKKKGERKQNTGRKTTASMKYGDGKLVVELLPDSRVGWYLLDSHREIQNNGEMDIEEYMDGTWLPYTETYGPGRWIPKQLINPVAKLFKKIGMRDDDWYGVNESRLRSIVKESVKKVLKEDYKAGEWNEGLFREDLKAYIEMSRGYDGSVGYAKAKASKMREVTGDLPWGINGYEFERWLTTFLGTNSEDVDLLVDNAVYWVRNKLANKPKPPRIY